MVSDNAPSLTPSGMTLPQFRAAGLPGLLVKIAASNGLTSSLGTLIRNGGPAWTARTVPSTRPSIPT